MKEADSRPSTNHGLFALKELSFGAVFYMDHRFFMKRAVRLALKGTGNVSPNPRVGAVIVRNGRIIAEGYHACFGGLHAEADALSKLKPGESDGCTLYVNLEPCNHLGKTPPCTEAIIRSGIKRVVVGVSDPNPTVAGKGIQRLKSAGIEVLSGILEEECLRINEAFFKFITRKIPFVTLKIAQTLDGKIAAQSGRSKWITCTASRRCVQRMRRESDAVLIGVGTALADDPELTVRFVPGLKHMPKRIVLDSSLRIPLDSKLMRTNGSEKTIIVAVDGISKKKIQNVRSSGAAVWTIRKNTEGRVDIRSFLAKAAEVGIASILVEGGKGIFTSFLKAGLADRIVLFTAPKLFGTGVEAFGNLGIQEPENAIQFRSVHWKRIGSDMVFDGRI